MGYKVTNITLDFQTGTENKTIYASWVWTTNYTDHYSVEWQYATGDGVWFAGQTSDVNVKNATYNPPENANKVRFRVKPIAGTRKVNGQDVTWWSADWSSWQTFKIPDKEDHTPRKGTTPEVEMNDFTLTASVTLPATEDPNTLSGEFRLIYDNFRALNPVSSIRSAIGIFSTAFSVEVGHTYKVQFRGVYNKNIKGEWSDFSSEIATKPFGIGNYEISAETETSVKLDWFNSTTGATGYKIEFTKNKDYFDHASSGVDTDEFDGTSSTFRIITGLETGETYYFRIAAKNDNGYSDWSIIKSITLGTIPDAPTTWQSTSTAVIGEDVILYWTHNSTDGSKETSAEIKLTISNETTTQNKIINVVKGDDSDVSQYVLSTKDYKEGFSLSWTVKTCGVLENEYSNESVSRLIKIYAKPFAYLQLYRGKKWYWDPFSFPEDDIYTAKGEYTDQIGSDDEITKFPFYISSISGGGNNQHPISCYWAIYADEAYETEDYTGETIWINDGEEIYNHESNLSKTMLNTEMGFEICLTMLPSTVRLENGIRYRVEVTITMDSGLVAKADTTFIMALQEDEWDLNAEIGYDADTISTFIKPTISANEKSPDVEYPNVRLAVFRRDYDGKFIELMNGILAILDTTITDPHPPLDYARYRIVGTSVDTGNIFYADIPAYPIPETSIIIQWDEHWRNFNTDNPDVFADPVTSGSMLKLPYNIATDENTDPDVDLVTYAGREHPVSYYGTQIGQNASWKTDIPRDDKETLYALRRLQRYMGDVYVREPNGTGYWANIQVSMNIENKAVIVPVSLTVKRVEGGV